MATILTKSIGYAGALAGEIFVQAFKKADTIDKNAITVLPNVIGNGYLPKISRTLDVKGATCGWNPTGTVGYEDKLVATKRLQVQDEICNADFAATFQAQTQGLFSANSEIPTSIQDALLLSMIEGLGAKVDSLIWNGLNNANEPNGLLPQFIADATVQKVTILAVTKANVVAEIEKVYNAVIAEVEDDETLVMAVSKNVAKSYKQAQASMGMNSTVGDKELDYLGVRMESIGGLPANSIVIYRVKNVAFLTGLQDDMNEVRISGDESRLDGQTRTSITFSMGVGYSFGSEIVYGKLA